VSQLRIRRDIPGALVVLDDGRYAVTGPLVAIGARESLRAWSERRMRSLPPDAEERAWLQNVNGALATDLPA
jgi:potassium/hydrogen antiporter